ncbi:MAG: tRNA ((37)-N6)-threonylcarbamoyltransferase complex dimerization subunit type 1 TsaB [Pseudomonadota bacterium]
MRILAIDTSTSWCSVALCFDDRPIVHRHEQLGSKASQHLLPWCSELLQQVGAGFKDLDALALECASRLRLLKAYQSVRNFQLFP